MTRKALAGRCPNCGARTIRGDAGDGQIATAELGELTAADELRAWAADTKTYRALWAGHMQLNERTTDDLRLDPAGFREGRIYRAHICTDSRETK